METVPPDKETKLNPPTLLNLPQHLRHRIYTFANIFGTKGSNRIDLNRHRTTHDWSHRMRPRYSSEQKLSFRTTYALLLTCRTIYTELVERVYAENHVSVRYKDFQNLSTLQQLSATAIRSMTSLAVHLNVSHGGPEEACCESMVCYSDEYNSRLNVLNTYTRQALDEWRQVWKDVIRPNLTEPGRLELHFICDVSSWESAQIALLPFLKETQPVLGGCSIRLSRIADRHLNKLAKKAALKAVVPIRTEENSTNSTPSSPFRFFDLPSELQLHILSFTDLVAPLGEVEWNYAGGLYYRSYDVTPPPLDESGKTHHANDKRWTEHGRVTCWVLSHPTGPFCRSCHSAFSTLDCCRVHKPPKEIFLVNKKMRQLALETFFTQNRFIITPSEGITWKWVFERHSEPIFQRLSVSFFLKEVIPKDALRHLQFLELVFPPSGGDDPGDYCAPTSNTWRDWVATLEYLKNELTLSKLTIRVYFASWLPDPVADVPPYRLNMDDARAEAMKKSYLDVIIPMKRLRGLRRFFAYLPDPAEWVGRNRSLHEPRLEELEEEAERVVMGHEYDAKSMGKLDMKDSIWLRVHLRRRVAANSRSS